PIVATDINPQAVANALYNAERLRMLDRVEVLRISTESPGPFSPFEPGETFDIILSNPPWEVGPVDRAAAHALYDPGFELLDGLLAEGAQRLKPGGRLMLAYGAREAIERIERLAPEHGWKLRVLDDRKLDDLPSVFLPGMLLELTR